MFSAFRERLNKYISPRSVQTTSPLNDSTSAKTGRQARLLSSPECAETPEALKAVKAGKIGKNSKKKDWKSLASLFMSGAIPVDNNINGREKLVPVHRYDDAYRYASDHDSSDESLLMSPLERKSKAKRTTQVKKIKVEGSDEESSDDSVQKYPKLTQGEAKEHIFDVDNERQRRLRALQNVVGMSQGQIELFNKLNLRGLEPLLPLHWAIDFKTVPDNLFSAHKDRPFLKSVSGHDFRATKALDSLFELGARVRDRKVRKLATEPTIVRSLNAYIKWAHEDAGLHVLNLIPTILVTYGLKGESVQQAVDRTTEIFRKHTHDYHIASALQNLAISDDHPNNEGKGKATELVVTPPSPAPTPERSAVSRTRPIPNTLYGFLVIQTLVSVVTYDTSKEDGQIRVIALFDEAKEALDVWNAFGFAIVAIMARNKLMKMGLPKPRPEVKRKRQESSDPDA